MPGAHDSGVPAVAGRVANIFAREARRRLAPGTRRLALTDAEREPGVGNGLSKHNETAR